MEGDINFIDGTTAEDGETSVTKFDECKQTEEEAQTFTRDEVHLMLSVFGKHFKRHDHGEKARILIERISAEVPRTVETYKIASKYKEVLGCEWSCVQLGVVMIGGIERFLLRATDKESLTKCVDTTITDHGLKYGVSPDMILKSWEVLRSFVLGQLEQEDGKIVDLFNRFFDMLRSIMLATTKE